MDVRYLFFTFSGELLLCCHLSSTSFHSLNVCALLQGVATLSGFSENFSDYTPSKKLFCFDSIDGSSPTCSGFGFPRLTDRYVVFFNTVIVSHTPTSGRECNLQRDFVEEKRRERKERGGKRQKGGKCIEF